VSVTIALATGVPPPSPPCPTHSEKPRSPTNRAQQSNPNALLSLPHLQCTMTNPLASFFIPLLRVSNQPLRLQPRPACHLLISQSHFFLSSVCVTFQKFHLLLLISFDNDLFMHTGLETTPLCKKIYSPSCVLVALDFFFFFY